jgi:hypothetical protein
MTVSENASKNIWLTSVLVLPWILPRKIHDTIILVVDTDLTPKVKSLRWLLSVVLAHQNHQRKLSHDNRILQSLENHNCHFVSQLNEIQRCLNSLASQNRIQQEEHFELERRLMEFKFGQDPMLMSSDSVFENCSHLSLGDLNMTINMRNIETNNEFIK